MKNLQEIIALCQERGIEYRTDEPLRSHTTFRIGGNAALFIEIPSETALAELLGFCRTHGIQHMIFGNGSNIIAADEGYDGVILHLGTAFSDITISPEGLCTCAAGATLARAAKAALDASMTGMECLSGVPGTVGGGLYMNAGAYGVEMRNVVVSARCITPSGEIITLSRDEMALGYRTSIFCTSGYIITQVTMQLEPGSYGEIKAEMVRLSNRRRAKQPLELPSAGSTFKRPAGSYASLLIDECGLKGASVGDAQVSKKHAGFVVNTGRATSHEVLELCDYIYRTVLEKTGYALELEPVLVGVRERYNDKF